MVLHADPVAEDGAAGERRRRVDGQDAELRHPAAARRGDEPVDERGLPRPGGPVMPTVSRLAPAAVGQGGDGPAGGAAALDQGQQAGQGHPVALRRRLEQRAGVGGRSRRPGPSGLGRRRRTGTGSCTVDRA